MNKVIPLIICMGVSSQAMCDNFKISSRDINDGELMPKSQEFTGFGCNGKNHSPHLSWSGAPKATKSFAITAYDPDAPTGSGWWHWQIVNLPASTHELNTGAGDLNAQTAPKTSVQIENDYGFQGFGGACPPAGDKAHRYQFTVHALSVDKLDVTPNSSGALVGFMINSNSIASSTLEALYQR